MIKANKVIYIFTNLPNASTNINKGRTSNVMLNILIHKELLDIPDKNILLKAKKQGCLSTKCELPVSAENNILLSERIS